MIPILYESTETTFTSNGICRLVDCISCVAIEGRNEIYEVEFEYPVSGEHFDDIQDGRYIACTHDEQGDIQPFEIYHHTEPIDGIVKYYARHISYALSKIIVKPFTASSCAAAMQEIKDKSINTNPFTFWTDKTTSVSYEMKTPRNARNILGGEDGSILDVFGGGEYKFDKYDVKLYASRGEDTDVHIRYGKNLIEFENDVNYSDTYRGIVPFWLGSDQSDAGTEVLVTLPEWYIDSGHSLFNGRVDLAALDMSSEFQEQPTASDLRSAAQSKLAASDGWDPTQNMKVNFVQLWQTEEYKELAPLQRCKLCDTVIVIHPEYNVEARIKIIKVNYNVLLEKYDSMELGEPSATFASTVAKGIDAATKSDLQRARVQERGYTAEAIDKATSLITGGDGGYVITRFDANKKPIEILIMDNEDPDQAVNVWRWNVNGFGYSSRGINGPYTTAITIDGQIVADFITAGTMSANLIRGGTLVLGGYGNANGVMSIESSNGSTLMTADNTGIYADYNNTHLRINRIGTRTTSHHGVEVVGIFSGYQAQAVALEGDYLQFYHKHAAEPFDYESLDESGWILVNYDYRNGGYYMSFAAGNDSIFHISSVGTYKIALTNNVQITGSLYTVGSKSRLAETDDYGRRLLYCYETPTPMFGDIGEGVIGEDGKAYIFIDSVFAETIEGAQYQVFIQKYGNGDAYISERAGSYFAVTGTPGLEFGWEIKAKQKGYSQRRLDDVDLQYSVNNTNYGKYAVEHLEQITRERS